MSSAFGKLAAEPKELRPLVEGCASCALRRLSETVAGAFHFVNRVGAEAVQLQDLGATHQTLTAEAHEICLRRAPSIERGRPFVHAPEVEDSSVTSSASG